MKIIHNLEKRTLTIQDGGTVRHRFINFLLVFNLANATFYGFDSTGQLQVIWLVVWVLSAIALIYRFFKKSEKSEFLIDDIKGIRKSDEFFFKHYVIELKNGRIRDLTFIKSNEDAQNLAKVIQGEIMEINTQSHLY